MATKKNQKKKQTAKQSNTLVVLIIIIVAAVLVVGLAYAVPAIVHKSRATHVKSIVSSLELDESYIKQKEFIYGDKRPNGLNGDKDKTAYVSYVRGENVDATVSDLRQKIEAAGFKFERDKNPNGAIVHYQFRSASGEVLYLSVSSKLRNDAIQNAALMGRNIDTSNSVNTNAGPSEVTIKIDIDAPKQ